MVCPLSDRDGARSGWDYARPSAWKPRGMAFFRLPTLQANEYEREQRGMLKIAYRCGLQRIPENEA